MLLSLPWFLLSFIHHCLSSPLTPTRHLLSHCTVHISISPSIASLHLTPPSKSCASPGLDADLWLRFLMLKNKNAPAISMPSMVMVDRMLYSGTLMWRRCRRTNVRSLGGSTPKNERRSDAEAHSDLRQSLNVSLKHNVALTVVLIGISSGLTGVFWTFSLSPVRLLSSLWPFKTCLFKSFPFNYKTVTLQQTYSHLRPIS